MSFYSEEGNFAFIHNPKTGGSSIRDMLQEAFDDAGYVAPCHTPASEVRKLVGRDEVPDVWLFGFVRDPYAWVESIRRYTAQMPDSMLSPWVDARYFKYWELSRDDHVSDAAMLTALKALCKPVVLVREGTRANPSRHTILIVMDVDGYRCLDTYHPNTGRSLDDLLLGVNRADGPETRDVKYFYGYC